MPCWVVERDSLLKMVMGAGKVTEIPAGDAGNAVSDQDLGAIGPGCGFAHEKLGHFAQRCGLAAVQMAHPKTVIGGAARRCGTAAPPLRAAPMPRATPARHGRRPRATAGRRTRGRSPRRSARSP